MIAAVTGRLAAKGPDHVVIETDGGVGYEILVPLGVLERLPVLGQRVTLLTELAVREDTWTLYGFADATERRFFQRLTTVSGVGPKLALALLSHLGPERAARAIRGKDVATLSSVSGIGRKTAERLALELGDKVAEFVGGGPPGEGAAVAREPPVIEAARRALERLGYAPAEAETAVRRALAGGDGAADTAALVRRALNILQQT